MGKYWKTPFYTLEDRKGNEIKFDVTTSVNTGLGPNDQINQLIQFMSDNDLYRVLDFGAGSLRHALPLLKAGFKVWAVEFEEQFRKTSCSEALELARQYQDNFASLIWPTDFIKDKQKFDVALLCYVIQTMPEPSERELVLKKIYEKLKAEHYMLYMGRYGYLGEGDIQTRRVGDGYYTHPRREYHSFYREYSAPEIHALMKRFSFRRIQSWGRKGQEQIFLYQKIPGGIR